MVFREVLQFMANGHLIIMDNFSYLQITYHAILINVIAK